MTGKWSGLTAGGCPNHPETHKNNPIYQVRVSEDMPVLRVQLKAPKEVHVGFEVVCVEARNTEAKGYFRKKSSGIYRYTLWASVFKLPENVQQFASIYIWA